MIAHESMVNKKRGRFENIRNLGYVPGFENEVVRARTEGYAEFPGHNDVHVRVRQVFLRGHVEIPYYVAAEQPQQPQR